MTSAKEKPLRHYLLVGIPLLLAWFGVYLGLRPAARWITFGLLGLDDK